MFWSKAIIYTIRSIFVINAVYLAFNLRFLEVGLLLGSLGLTFIPELFTKLTRVKITMGGRITYSVFIFCSQWLGTYLRFYDSIIWWDIMLHFSSGIFLGYIGILVFIWIDWEHLPDKNSSHVMLMIFSFLISVSSALFWEIGEFLSDTFLGSYTQLGSIRDTMEYMIFGTIGALLFVIYLWAASYKKRDSTLNRLIELNKTYKEGE
jgi:hypothetical protein